MLHTLHPPPLLMSTKRPTTDDSPLSSSSSPKRLNVSDPPSVNESETTGLKLLTLLLQCAECVSTNNLDDAVFNLLPEITQFSSPYGSSPQRVAAYFSHALHSRVIKTFLSSTTTKTLKTLTHPHKTFNALQCFNSIAPLIKFSHFTANQAIFESLHGHDSVHIVDLDIMQGLQWPGLFHILATRQGKIRSLRVTGFGSSSELLNSTGRRLAEFASSLGLPFEFNPIEGKIGNLVDPGRLRGVEPGREEAVVVHMMQHCLYDITGSDFGMLRLLSLLRPRLITIVEQDLSSSRNRGNVGFLERFVEALHYYSALFDAVGDGLGEESVERHLVERELFGIEIRNILGVDNGEGGMRVERWGEELRRVGFRPVSLGGSPATQASLLLGMFPWKGYTLLEENGSLKLGWKDLSLLTASAWEPVE